MRNGPTISLDTRGLATSLVYAALPTAPVLALLYCVTPAPAPDTHIALDITSIFIAVILVPFFETALISYPATIAMQATGRIWLAAALGGSPLAAIHLINSWQNSIAVLWLFIWSAYCYLALAKTKEPALRRYLFVFAMHAIWNATSLGLLAITRSDQ